MISAQKLLRELVAIPSVSSQSNRPVVEWIQRFFEPFGWHQRVFCHRVEDGRDPTYHHVWRGTGPPCHREDTGGVFFHGLTLIEGELTVGCTIRVQQPEMIPAAIRGTVLHHNDDVLEIGRELRTGDAAQVTEIIVGREV